MFQSLSSRMASLEGGKDRQEDSGTPEVRVVNEGRRALLQIPPLKPRQWAQVRSRKVTWEVYRIFGMSVRWALNRQGAQQCGHCGGKVVG